MTGMVVIYDSVKGVGRIKGDDANTYVFHTSSVSNRERLPLLSHDAYVSFDGTNKENALSIEILSSIEYLTEKNRLLSCGLINISDALKSDGELYVFPDKFMTSENGWIEGYDILYNTNYYVFGSTSSPGVIASVARQDAIDQAKKIGANGLINMTSKSTEITRFGQKFMMHSCAGIAVFVGKRGAVGVKANEIKLDLNKNIETELSKAENKRTNVFIFTATLMIAIGLLVSVFVGLLVAVISVIVASAAAIASVSKCCTTTLKSYIKIKQSDEASACALSR